MKPFSRIILTLFCGALMLSCGVQRRGKLSLMTYNVITADPTNEDIRDYVAVAIFVDRFAPDVVTLQGIDFMTGRERYMDAIAVFGHWAEMESGFTRNILLSDHAYGVGILSANNPLASEGFVLPGSLDDPVALLHEYSDCVVLSVHLSPHAADQMEAVRLLDSVARARGNGRPVFVAGDFNFTPDSDAFRLMSRSFKLLNDPDHPSYPGHDPVICVDYIWAYTGSGIEYEATDKTVYKAPRNNPLHRPVGVSVRFRRPRD